MRMKITCNSGDLKNYPFGEIVYWTPTVGYYQGQERESHREADLPDNTEDFFKAVQPYGRFSLSKDDQTGMWIICFEDTYD